MLNIFAEMIHSIYDIPAYAKFLKNRMGRTILYGFVLCLFYFLTTTGLSAVLSAGMAGSTENVLSGLIPDFSLKDGVLTIDKPIELKEYDDYQGGIYLKIDTSGDWVEEISDVDLLAFNRVVLVDGRHILVKEGDETIRSSLGELELGNWTKDSLLTEWLPYIKVGLAVGSVFLVWAEFMGFFLGVLVTALMGAAIAGILRFRMRFDDLCKLAVHARTLPILLKVICEWLPVMLPLFMVVNFGISAVYLWKAIGYLKGTSETPAMPQ